MPRHQKTAGHYDQRKGNERFGQDGHRPHLTTEDTHRHIDTDNQIPYTGTYMGVPLNTGKKQRGAKKPRLFPIF